MNSFVLFNQTHPHFSLPWTEVKVQASFKSFLYKLVISWNKTKAGVPIIKKKNTSSKRMLVKIIALQREVQHTEKRMDCVQMSPLPQKNSEGGGMSVHGLRTEYLIKK